ncbi:MAG: sulfotransferase [Bacteroidales bacterium]|nr:sulfotransferase [Bacteroidales bacterium]MCF8456785.1 sulfotransferase [Bacteroidales bacterium]
MATNTQIGNISNIPFFFIIGRPRSGTTLIQSILDAHPNVVIPGECPIILRIYSRYGHLKELNENTIETLIEAIKQLPGIEFWPIDFNEVKQDLLKAKGKFDFQKIIKIIYLNFQSVFPKSEILTFGDKNPPYSKFPKLILKIFPDAKFIHIVRDYRDHFLSVKKTGLISAIEPVTIYLWKRSVIRIGKLARKYPDQIFTLNYESFVSKPESHLRDICSFLNIPFEAEILKFHDSKKLSLEQYGEKNREQLHKKLYSPIDASNTGKWKKELTESEVMTADFIAGKTGSMAGYEKKFRKIPWGLKARLIIRLAVIKMYLYYVLLLKILPAGVRKKIKRRTPELNTFYLKFFKS